MEVHIAQVFCVILRAICDIFASSLTQSCTDVTIEAKFKAGKPRLQRLRSKRGIRTKGGSDDGVPADSLSARTSQQNHQRFRDTLDLHLRLALSRSKRLQMSTICSR